MSASKKWHVNPEGNVGKCTANIKDCPYVNFENSHFETKAEAESRAVQVLDEKYGTVSSINTTIEDEKTAVRELLLGIEGKNNKLNRVNKNYEMFYEAYDKLHDEIDAHPDETPEDKAEIEDMKERAERVFATIQDIAKERYQLEQEMEADAKKVAELRAEMETKKENLKTRNKIERTFNSLDTDRVNASGNFDNSYVIPAYLYEDAKKKIDKTNKRLEKLGIDGRFEYTEHRYLVRKPNENGVEEAYEMVRLEFNQPKISYGGYTFLAKVEKEEGGLVTRSPRGVDLEGWRPESQLCEHCNQKRAREKTYLVQDAEGSRKQVGHSCLQAYMGIKPEGLRYMTFNPVDEYTYLQNQSEQDMIKDWGGGGHKGNGASHISRDDTLAFALAVAEEQGGFRAKGYGNESTYEQVHYALRGNTQGDTPEDKAWREKIRARAAELKKNGEVEKLIKEVEEMPDGSDWGNNLKVLAKSEYVKSKNDGLLISAVAVRTNKENQQKEREEREKEFKSSFATGYSAPVGESVKGKRMEIVSTASFSRNPQFYGDDGIGTVVTMKDEDGKMVTWFSSKSVSYEPGTKLLAKSGKVSKHGNYKGVDQTVVSRMRLEEETPQNTEATN